MSGSSQARPLNSSAALSIQHQVHDYAEALVPTYEHCGLMTNGLRRLGDVEDLLQDTIERNDHLLRAIQSKVQHELAVIQRLRQESAAREAQVQDQIVEAVRRIECAFAGTEEDARRSLDKVLNNAKTCNTVLARDVRAGQTAWMRLHAQLVALNAWPVTPPNTARNPRVPNELDTHQSNTSVTQTGTSPPGYETAAISRAMTMLSEAGVLTSLMGTQMDAESEEETP
ncbi:hypothetical protein CF319_g7109 [Tilletia indica]|nr:hypothetical protein CF319_g7109 [Tilletia indica]